MRRLATAGMATVLLLAAACSTAETQQANDRGSSSAATAAGTGAATNTDPVVAGTPSTSPGSIEPGAVEATAGTDPAGVTADCEVGEVDGALALYNWTDYMDPDLIAKFRDEFAIDVIEDYYPNNEDLLARFEAGADGYDVIVPSDYMVGIMSDQGMLLQLDKDALPNLRNLDETFTAAPFDPQGTYSVAFQWGTTGLGINVDELGDDVEPTWGLIFDPELSEPYAGRISLLDSSREAIGAALQYLGYPLNSTDEEQISEAADLVADARDRVLAFDSDQFEDRLVQGETVLGHGYSGDFASAFDGSDGSFQYVIPKEGAVLWVDSMVIPANAPHPCTAHTFINFILDAQNGAQLTNWTFFASPNAESQEYVEAEILDDPAIYPPPEVDENLKFIEDTGATEQLYTDLFEQAKG